MSDTGAVTAQAQQQQQQQTFDPVYETCPVSGQNGLLLTTKDCTDAGKVTAAILAVTCTCTCPLRFLDPLVVARLQW